ncbi:DUF5688 family protein [Blautia wexlerae]|uniref:DUF5688 family protein n=1 Tax=Blautia wexlerae TaxID=418240 RepID=UPI00189CF6F0|nr:DUF5688 family protein [Blautia wexlerae]
MDKNYELFIKQLINGIHDITDIPLENIKFTNKEGDRLNITFAEHDDAYEVCSVHVEELYVAYQNGIRLNTIVDYICSDVLHAKSIYVYDKTKELMDYDTAKSRLFVRLINYDRNADILRDVVHKTLGDIVFTVYAIVDENEFGIVSTKVLKSMVKKWDKNEDDIFNEAIKNTYRATPPRIYKWEGILCDESYAGESFMNDEDICDLDKSFSGNILSTTRKTNGAVAVFLPGVAEKISELLDSDFYMVFTSIHEVMIHSTGSGVDLKDLKLVLQDTLREATPSSDYLTEKIYKYNRRTHKFECVTD